MDSFQIPEEKKVRVILNTDAKNEVDDQFAIVQALLTESFDLKGLVAAHFGKEKSPHSMEDSYEEIKHLLTLMGKENSVPVFRGAERAIDSETDPVDSEGARLIIEEAMKEDHRPLYLAFLGPLTDMASALILEPEIQRKKITVIWTGGRNWPTGGWEYNLQNDILAANLIFTSHLPLWQIPRNVYRMVPVSFTEMKVMVYPYGKIGRYLTENVIRFNNSMPSRPVEYRNLGDSPAIGVIMYPDCGQWENKPAPEINADMHYIHTGKNREIRVYQNISARFILEDFYAKLKLAYGK